MVTPIDLIAAYWMWILAIWAGVLIVLLVVNALVHEIRFRIVRRRYRQDLMRWGYARKP